jgi:hypothetical protein
MFNINIPVMIMLSKANPKDKRRRRGVCYYIYIALGYTSFLLYNKPWIFTWLKGM